MPGGFKNIGPQDGKLFKPGDARINRLGAPRKMNLDKLLRKVLMEKINNQTAIKGILIKLRDQALDGDIRSAELLLDRAFGKAKTTTEQSRPFAVIGIQYVTPTSTTDGIITIDNKTHDEATSGLGSIET